MVEEPIDNNVKELKLKLKKSLESNKMLEKEYKKCEKELRLMTEETFKLKIEIKDLKEIVALKKELEEIDAQDDVEDISENNILKMKSQGYKRGSPQVEASPKKYTIKSKFMGVEYNCNECYYQGTSKTELSKHVHLKHMKEQKQEESTIKCRNCGEQSSSKWNLMFHRKSKHMNTVARCKNYLEGKCHYADDICWWNHGESKGENIECFICSKSFETKPNLMTHRKKVHRSVIKSCTQFLLGICRFKDESCWFLHSPANDQTQKMR